MYRLAAALANDVNERVACWPSFERWSLGIQLVRAADSIGANIAESSGRWHPRDKRHLLVVARGSLYETEHWLSLAEQRGLITEDFSARLAEVARTLSGLLKTLEP